MRQWWNRLRPFAWYAVILAGALLIGFLRGPGTPPLSFDMDSAAGSGARALALYLEGSGWRVQTQTVDPYAISPADGVLLLTPDTMWLQDQQSASRLAEWVHDGGRLLLLGGTSPFAVGMPSDLGGQATGSGNAPSAFAFEPPPLLPVSSGAGSVRVRSADPSLAEVGQVALERGWRWDTTGDALTNWHGVLSNTDGALVLVRRDTGAGQVLAISDPSALTNQYLPQADNLMLALALTDDGRRRELGLLVNDPAALLRRGAADEAPPLPLSWRLLLWGLGLAAVLGFWLMGRRTGPVLPLEATPPRPATEFLEAQAHAYRRAQANSAILRYAYSSFRRELARRAGVAPQASTSALVEAAPRIGLPPGELRSVLERTEAALPRRLTEKEMLTLVHDLAVMQRRMAHAQH